jgi:4-diphosphocytidyl-2-C-methyl-D-erythritol kinase
LIVYPNSKINLGLRILRKRSDNYHDIETIFYPISLHDILEIIPAKNTRRERDIPFSQSGFALDGEHTNNLCIKAYRLLKKDFPRLPPVQMHLHKGVPAGAGLGGGSADAAFTLLLLNQEFDLKIETPRLIKYAAQLGSDCAFFLINKPCFATSRGEQLEPIAVDLSAYKFVIVNPGIQINTGMAFSQIVPTAPGRSLKEIVLDPVDRWKDGLYNDFEKTAFKKHPEIVDIKDQLYVAGAAFASMSGSGSTVYGLFPKEKTITLTFPENYFVRELPG